jgi:Flp pilus assembly pilin Flp
MVELWTRIHLGSRLWSREDGQDIVEYALLVGLLSMFALAIVLLVGPAVKDTFQYVVNGLQSA